MRGSRIGTTQTTHSNNVCGVLNLLGCWFLLHISILAVTTDIGGIFSKILNNIPITDRPAVPPLEGWSESVGIKSCLFVFCIKIQNYYRVKHNNAKHESE